MIPEVFEATSSGLLAGLEGWWDEVGMPTQGR